MKEGRGYWIYGRASPPGEPVLEATLEGAAPPEASPYRRGSGGGEGSVWRGGEGMGLADEMYSGYFGVMIGM